MLHQLKISNNMVCSKCGYKDKKEIKKGDLSFCRICGIFAPSDKNLLKKYSSEKMDWKVLETFRKYNSYPGIILKKGMVDRAVQGGLMVRPPKGYSLYEGKLIQNKDSQKIHSLFLNYLKHEGSFNCFSKKMAVSFNSLKNILTNRTYLGEIKFDGCLYKSPHKPLVEPELFYAVQRKLKKEGLIK